MLKKTTKILAFLLLLNAVPVFANSSFYLNNNNITGISLEGIASAVTGGLYSVKKGQPYSETNDPIFHSNGPETPSPQHGYFAVPLIVIGLAGILLYFSRND